MKKHQFKILSIDGGGIRGIIPCTVLAFIENQIGPLARIFDLMAGTSTGGIITLGLVTPDAQGGNAYTANDMLQLYTEHGKDIFKARKKDLWSRMLSVNNRTKEISQHPYEETAIEKILLERFSNITLNQSLTEVLITTYEINKGNAFYFLSRLAREQEAENLEMKVIARATSAAPTYFTPSLVQWKAETEVFVDGGVFANNPSILAYGEAKELWKRKGQLAFEPQVMANDQDFPFFMLSIGTGHCPESISATEAQDWTTAGWIKPLLTNVFMNSVAASTHFTMQHLLPSYTDGTPRYTRLNVPIPEKNKDMDDASERNVEALQEIAEKYVRENQTLLLKICAWLTD